MKAVHWRSLFFGMVLCLVLLNLSGLLAAVGTVLSTVTMVCLGLLAMAWEYISELPPPVWPAIIVIAVLNFIAAFNKHSPNTENHLDHTPPR